MIQVQKKSIEVEVTENSIAICRIARPDRRNALTRETRLDLTDLINTFAANQEIRAIILASSESSFSSGQDLSEAKDFTPNQITAWIEEHMSLYRAVLSYPRPIIAAIGGCCVGAGLQTALLCDLRVGSNDAYFAMPELDDAIPCILGVWTLWDIIGRARTAEMVLTNCKVSAEKALDWGIINELTTTEDLLPKALALAEQLANKPALAFRLTKERLRLLMLQEQEALSVHASYAHMVAFNTNEPRQAMEAFLSGQRR